MSGRLTHSVWNTRERVGETGGAVLRAAARVVRQKKSRPPGGARGLLDLLGPDGCTATRSQVVAEGDPLALRPGHGSKGIGAPRRAGSGALAPGGAERLAGQGQRDALGPGWRRLQRLEGVIGQIPGGRRARGEGRGVFAWLALGRG